VMKPTGTGILLDTGMQKDQCIMQYIMSWVSSDPEECENLSSTGSLEMCKSMIKNRPTIGNPSSNDNTKLQIVAPTPPSAPAIPK
jgi:hypothetical protein